VRRVLLVFEPPDGGVPEHVGELACGLDAHGWEAEVAGPLEAALYRTLAERGVPVHRLPLRRGYSRPDAEARALSELIALSRERDFDLVHCHASKAGVLGRLAALASGTPSLYSPHCFAFTAELGASWRVASTAIERALGRIPSSAILCVCESERQVALRARVGTPGRLFVVRNGCRPCPERIPPDPAVAALGSRGPIAGAVAALREQKQLDVLIEATPLILAREPEAGVAVVGDGPLHEQLQACAARMGLDSDERFALLPFTPPAARALKALDVYVLPSSWEAFPIGILEALACGVPQVVTDVGGNAEAIGADTGVLVPPRDPAALADAVVALLGDPARRAAAAEASRRRHAEHFGISRMVAETVSVYESVIAVGRSGADSALVGPA
jgi:glycosyltransferase involved in cell wall biosynthesis